MKERLAELPRALTVPNFDAIRNSNSKDVFCAADCQKHHELHFFRIACCNKLLHLVPMFHSFQGLVSTTLNYLFFVMGPKSKTVRLWR